MTDVCPNTQDWAKAIHDANKCISVKPDWGKGYGRKGAALYGAGDLEGALKAYTDGLAVEPGANLTTYKTCIVTCTVVLLTEFRDTRRLHPIFTLNNICRLHVNDTNQPLFYTCTGLAMLTNGLAEVTAQIRAEVNSIIFKVFRSKL